MRLNALMPLDVFANISFNNLLGLALEFMAKKEEYIDKAVLDSAKDVLNINLYSLDQILDSWIVKIVIEIGFIGLLVLIFTTFLTILKLLNSIKLFEKNVFKYSNFFYS